MTITAKEFSPYGGTSIVITYNGADTVPALATITDHNGDNPTDIEFNRIIKVINNSGSPQTIYGHVFQAGTTDLQQYGSLPITPINAGDPLEGAANLTVVLTGALTWGDDHTSAPS